jgi:hypothetical protein
MITNSPGEVASEQERRLITFAFGVELRILSVVRRVPDAVTFFDSWCCNLGFHLHVQKKNSLEKYMSNPTKLQN